ncbi:MAG: multidrug efflux SMR transporter [Kaiparowitsia implicata GSE-PSE-MK54-09C]|jgi:small multidrug resistance pump|nr:multidrug efflux SMR transporter [Kaiparowitsia implicata GSE-PSE-MK54-09C]
MSPLLLLFLAIASEVIASTALKASQGFTRLGFSIIVLLGYPLAFYLFALSLKHIPLSVAYATWSGVGIVGTVLIGAIVFRETMNWGMVGSTAIILTGVILLNHFMEG